MSKPKQFSDITLPFLQRCLSAKGHDGDQLKGFSTSEVPEPGQTAAMTFIDLAYDTSSKGLPGRLIAKQRTDYEEAAAYIDSVGGTSREISFYAHIGKACQLDIPEFYYGYYEKESGEFLLIMEDRTGPPPGDWVTANLTQAESLMQSLVNMHAHWWQDPSISGAGWTAKFSSEPGCTLQVMQQSFQGCAESFVEVFKDEIDDHLADLVTSAFNKPHLIEAFDNRVKTLIHGDYHYKNALFPPGQAPVVFDWQLAGHGPPSIDIGRTFIFLGGSDINAQTDALLLKYHQALEAAGIANYTYNQLQEDMALGFLYNVWLTIVALMETDVQIIRQVIAAKGSSVEKVLLDSSQRVAHSDCQAFVDAY
jgi:hypothetical protein